MRRWTAASVLAAALAACVGRAAGPVTPMGFDPIREAAAVRGAATAFILEEARGDTAADTLLDAGATLIANGVAVAGPPRLASVLGPGSGTVDALETQLAGDVAWVVAAYRWTAPDGADERRARATIVLERRPAGWRIRHVHSSAVAPWQ